MNLINNNINPKKRKNCMIDSAPLESSDNSNELSCEINTSSNIINKILYSITTKFNKYNNNILYIESVSRNESNITIDIDTLYNNNASNSMSD